MGGGKKYTTTAVEYGSIKPWTYISSILRPRIPLKFQALQQEWNLWSTDYEESGGWTLLSTECEKIKLDGVLFSFCVAEGYMSYCFMSAVLSALHFANSHFYLFNDGQNK